MPLFGSSKKDKKEKLQDDSNEHQSAKQEKNEQESKAQQMAKQLSFNAQLAHGSHTVKIADFSNVKELYQRIAEGLEISISEV